MSQLLAWFGFDGWCHVVLCYRHGRCNDSVTTGLLQGFTRACGVAMDEDAGSTDRLVGRPPGICWINDEDEQRNFGLSAGLSGTVDCRLQSAGHAGGMHL